MTEFITRNYGNKDFEVIIKTDNKEHYKETQEFARRLIDHAKPATGNNVGSKWIPVTERLPEDNVQVLACTKHGKPFTAHCAYGGKWKVSGSVTVTHWMPLPEPPKEVE